MRKRFVIFMISVCVLMFVAAGVHFYDLYQQWSSSEALLGRAAIAVRKNQLSEAEILVRNAIKADPDNVDARLQIANILTAISIERGEKESPAAVEQLIHAARLAPDDVTVQTRVFDSLMRLGRHKAALEYAQKAVDQGSDHVLALWALLAAELKSENWETADRLLNRLEKVSDPQNDRMADQSQDLTLRRRWMTRWSRCERSLASGVRCRLVEYQIAETFAGRPPDRRSDRGRPQK